MIVGYQNEEELMRRVRSHATRVPASDFMHREEPTFIKVSCPMSGKQEKAYTQMKTQLLAEMDRGVITAQNALVKIGKLQQIAAGFIIDEDGNTEWLGNNKVDAVLDLVAQLDEPVIIFSHLRALQAEIIAGLEESGVARDRPVYRYEGRQTVDAWKKTGGLIVGNQASGLGIGQNLQMAAATIYASHSYSSEARWQSLKRTDRIGQKRHCRYWDMVVHGTVDIKVLKALADKEDIARRNIDGLRRIVE
jgi:SNF2 family DNA or RNA helicase